MRRFVTAYVLASIIVGVIDGIKEYVDHNKQYKTNDRCVKASGTVK